LNFTGPELRRKFAAVMRDEAKSLLFVLYAKWGPEVQNLIGEILKLFLFNQTRRADGRAGERRPFLDAG
jgi:hypothetical protein